MSVATVHGVGGQITWVGCNCTTLRQEGHDAICLRLRAASGIKEVPGGH